MAESATLNTANVWRQSRITVFGDSISKGLYLENGRICRVGRSAVTILTERYGVGADNFSAYGQTLKKCWEKGHFERFLRETPPGSVLAVALGGNDCDYRWEEVAEAPLAAHAPNTPLPEFGEILRKVIALLRAHAPVFLPASDRLAAVFPQRDQRARRRGTRHGIFPRRRDQHRTAPGSLQPCRYEGGSGKRLPVHRFPDGYASHARLPRLPFGRRNPSQCAGT